MKIVLIGLITLIMSWEPSCSPGDYSSSGWQSEDPVDPSHHDPCTGSISGNVIDSVTHAPIRLASVSFANGYTSETVQTSRIGEFKFGNLCSNSYWLIAKCSSYQTDSVDVSVTNGNVSAITIRLQPESGPAD